MDEAVRVAVRYELPLPKTVERALDDRLIGSDHSTLGKRQLVPS